MAVQSKYHITIDGYGFMLARQTRTERHIYGREEIPHFVNKFSSGDPNYRDSTFFPHFVQNNWLNGFDQEKFNDGGKFYRSSQVDPTIQEKLTLQKAISSAGTIGAGAKCFGVRSSSASIWWDTNYGYRQQLTITAPAGQALAVGQTIKTTIDTAALQTATKLLANRNDWRIVYFNGNSFVDLSRDYLNTTTTFFALQAAIAAGQSDSNYYVYYSYSSASTNKQPTTEAEWNAVYGMFGSTPDANYVTIWHFKEGTGTSVDDDTAQEHTITLNGTVTWGTDGPLGRWVDFGVGSGYGRTPDTSDLDLGTFTLETLIYKPASSESYFLTHGRINADGNYSFHLNEYGKLLLQMGTGPTTEFSALDDGSGVVPHSVWTWVAVTYDAAGTVKFYYNGVLSSTQHVAMTAPVSTTRDLFVNSRLGAADNQITAGPVRLQHTALSNIVRTSFPTHLSPTNQPTASTGGEIAQAAIPSTGTFEVYVADEDGKVYLWDGGTVWTEVFDTRRIMWHDTVASGDTDYYVGDNGGTERAQAQSFQLDTAQRVKSVEVYIKKANGTPGDITVRIETNGTGPSGTLADANLATTITAFTTSTYGWVTVEFPASAVLSASTTYWIVLETAAAANDTNYQWLADASSPSFSTGSRAHSADGGATWTVDTAADFLIRIKGEATQVNQISQATFSSTTKLYFATGDPTSSNQANARIYTYDGTTWVLLKVFTGVGTGCALCLQVYNTKLYVGLGPTALIYSFDGTTWTLAKDIDQPDNPGFVYDMEVYNQRLYACGGNPEFVSTNNSQGFLFSYDEFQWNFVYDFSFTVIKSLKVFDNLLFLGTTSKKLYVYNTASMDKLLDFPWEVSINWMEVFDDKLAVGLGAVNTLTGEEAVYLFDRNGFHKAFVPPSVGVSTILSTRNQLLIGTTGTTIYKVDPLVYSASGTVQISYFEASLPSIDKKWRSLILQYEALPSGCTILAEYKTDESDASWTTLGTASTVGSIETEFEFSNAFYSKKISIRLTLATTNTTVTPTLKLTDLKYVLMPDFKYLWKFSVVCVDNIEWLDRTSPITKTTETIIAGSISITVKDTGGFPTKGRGVLVDGTTEDEFTWTGKTATTLTGIPATGDLALTAHTDTGLVVKITGGSLHRLLRSLKQTKQLFDFVDFDNTTYETLFHGYQEDNFVINTEGQENNVPITLLEV